MTLHDLAPLIHARRTALGLSQDRLAKLCGLSRATVNQLENGTLVNLGASKLLALLSQTASVSYRRVLQPAELTQALVQGDLPEAITPHIATLLDKAPLALILAAVEQAALTTRTPPKTLWKHLVQWAHALQSPTPAWA